MLNRENQVIFPPLNYYDLPDSRDNLTGQNVFVFLDLLNTTFKKVAQVPGFKSLVPAGVVSALSHEIADTLATLMPGVQVVTASMNKVKWDMTDEALKAGENGDVTMSLDPRFVTSRPDPKHIRQVQPTRIFDAETGIRIGRVGRPSFLPPEVQIADVVSHARKIGAVQVNIADDALLSADTMRATANSVRAKGMNVGTIFTAVGDKERTARFSQEIGARVQPLIEVDKLVDFTLPASMLFVPGGGSVLGARFPVPNNNDHSAKAEFLRKYGVETDGQVLAILGSGFTNHHAAVFPLSGPGLRWLGIPEEFRDTEAAWDFRIKCLVLSIDFWMVVESINGNKPFRFSDYIKIGEKDADVSQDHLREFLKIYRPSKPRAIPIHGTRSVVYSLEPFSDDFLNRRIIDWLQEQRINLTSAKASFFDQLRPPASYST